MAALIRMLAPTPTDQAVRFIMEAEPHVSREVGSDHAGAVLGRAIKAWRKRDFEPGLWDQLCRWSIRKEQQAA